MSYYYEGSRCRGIFRCMENINSDAPSYTNSRCGILYPAFLMLSVKSATDTPDFLAGVSDFLIKTPQKCFVLNISEELCVVPNYYFTTVFKTFQYSVCSTVISSNCLCTVLFIVSFIQPSLIWVSSSSIFCLDNPCPF